MQSTTAERLLKAELQRKYVKDLWLFLAAVLGLLTCLRIVRLLLSRLPGANLPYDERVKVDPEAHGFVQEKQISLRIFPGAFASAFKFIAFRCTIPIGFGAVASVSELTFIVGYIVVIFAMLMVDTQDYTTAFYEDRAAHFAACQLPLIVALAGKNNIISFLVGVGHEKLNVLHRAAARTCLILLWMHAISRTVTGLPENFGFEHGWMKSGVLGLVAFSLATALSIRPIRQVAFEFFLIAHIILVSIFLIGGYMHARDPGFGDYIWPALVVWAFDRILRGIRLVFNNRLWNLARDGHSTATIELLSVDTVRLTFRRRFNWKAGQHAYVIIPSVSNLPTEAHPFTIASIPDALDGSCQHGEKDVVFLIRGRSGFTGRLRDHAISGKCNTVTALIDGPYGCPPDLKSFSTCVLISGGSGVSYTLPLLMDIVRNANAGKSSVKRIVFVWAVRDGDHLLWISQSLIKVLESAPSTLNIEPRVYITGPNYPIPEIPSLEYNGQSTPPTPSKEDKFGLPTYSALKLLHGRPSIPKVLNDEILGSTGPVSVEVAGPSALSQSVRKALRSKKLANPVGVLRGVIPPVALHVETFGMVKG